MAPRGSRDYYDDRPAPYTVRAMERDDSCALCLKYVTVTFNIIYMILALAACAISLWILIDKSYLTDMMNNKLMAVSCWLIILGSGSTALICIVGLCGAVNQNKSLLFAYGGSLIVLALILITGGLLAVILKGEIGDWLKDDMEEAIREHYGVNLDDKYNQEVTQAWDKGQTQMACCAVQEQSWGLYRQSLWYAEQPGVENLFILSDMRNVTAVQKPLVPKSCCKRDENGKYLDEVKCQTFTDGPPGEINGVPNNALHYRGCFSAGEEWIDKYSSWLAGLGIGLGVLLVAGIFASIWLGIKANRRREKIWR